MEPILAAEWISKSYGSQVVLRSARITAYSGLITVLVGRNGAGKTTLQNVITGVAAPDAGLVRFRGRTQRSFRWHHLARRGLYYLPASGVLAPALPFRKQLGMMAERFGNSAVDTACERLRLNRDLETPPAYMSPGEARRAELCLAYSRNPVCLVADEPLQGVDPLDTETLIKTLRALADSGCAIVVSVHSPHALTALADRVFWLTSNTTQEFDSPAAALSNDFFRRDYLGDIW